MRQQLNPGYLDQLQKQREKLVSESLDQNYWRSPGFATGAPHSRDQHRDACECTGRVKVLLWLAFRRGTLTEVYSGGGKPADVDPDLAPLSNTAHKWVVSRQRGRITAYQYLSPSHVPMAISGWLQRD